MSTQKKVKLVWTFFVRYCAFESWYF